MIPVQSANTNVTFSNHTGSSQVVKSKKITTTKSYDENGKLYSEETVEEIEYVTETVKVLPTPVYYDNPLGGKQWWHKDYWTYPEVTW